MGTNPLTVQGKSREPTLPRKTRKRLAQACISGSLRSFTLPSEPFRS